ncbi:MAG TPA: serine/threonine-protein kinase, partial [Ktedonobacterales bacterium]|nr:serine/threonine-protein kinase [Ktedonobacterales bacterium]
MTSVGGQGARLIGRTLDVYVLRSLLGAGGMAEVYRAFETPLGREVAVKVLPETLARDPGYVERFRNEAKQVAALNHPHITPVYHYGEEQGLLFLVMPLLKESLRDRLDREGRLGATDATRLTVQIASALDAAHARGLVHRDVKPENILLNTEGKAMLTDFGIAREVSFLRETGAARTLAASGLPVGTPEYMAPEQLRAALVDQRADLYSLGAVLYELLTGVAPHEAATPYEVAALALTAPVAAPSTHNPAIWPELDGVVLKTLEKEPGDRYQTARSFALALREVVVNYGQGGATSIPSVRWTHYVPAQPGQSGALSGGGAPGTAAMQAMSAISGARNPLPPYTSRTAHAPQMGMANPLSLPELDDEETQPSLHVSGKSVAYLGYQGAQEAPTLTGQMSAMPPVVGGARGGRRSGAIGSVGAGRGWSRRRGFWLLMSAGALAALVVGLLGAMALGGFDPFGPGNGAPSVGKGALTTPHAQATATYAPTPT